MTILTILHYTKGGYGQNVTKSPSICDHGHLILTTCFSFALVINNAHSFN